MKRVNISLSEELLQKIDERAAAMYLNRSAYIATALAQKMAADDALKNLPEITEALRQASAALEAADKKK